MIVLVVSARERIGSGDRYIARRVFGLDVPVVIAVNKVERLKPGHIATQMHAAAALGDHWAPTASRGPRGSSTCERGPSSGITNASAMAPMDAATSGPGTRNRRGRWAWSRDVSVQGRVAELRRA